MTAPMDLTDDERKRQEQLYRIVEQETSATMSARYNAKRELEALQKLSDARAALREAIAIARSYACDEYMTVGEQIANKIEKLRSQTGRAAATATTIPVPQRSAAGAGKSRSRAVKP